MNNYKQGWKQSQQSVDTDGYAIERGAINHDVIELEDIKELPNPSTAHELAEAVDKMLFFPPKRR